MELTEAEVKKEVEALLKILTTQGKVWYERMNAGAIIRGRHNVMRGAKKGTADFIVIQGGEVQMRHGVQQTVHAKHPIAFVTFIECKSSTGKQKPDQIEFEKMIVQFNCRYAIVRSVEELKAVLDRE